MTQEPDQTQVNTFQHAYKQFALESERVEWIYQNLEARFKKIRETVQESHVRLAGKLTELEFISLYLETILTIFHKALFLSI